jgi:hypothetical protein
MATTFKTFLNNDVTTTKTLLHEAIPITGAILSGTYTSGQGNDADNGTYTAPAEYNIKNYSHGMFQSVYDYPHLSSSANHILDISCGYSTGSALSGSTKQFAANGSSLGTTAVAGGGLTKNFGPDTQFVSKVTVAQGSIGDGSSIITLVTPLGTSITATANASTTTNAAVASGVALAATYESTTNDTTLAVNVATCLNAHAEILAESAAGVVFIKFLSRAVNAHNDTFIGSLNQQEKKIAMYNQMAQVLMGHDKDGKIQRFDRDGNLAETSNDKMDEVIFLNFSRLLVKDEIKKGSFQIKFGTEQAKATADMNKAAGVAHLLTIKDTNAQNDFRINSPAGEYGILSASHTVLGGEQGIIEGRTSTTGPYNSDKVGLIFYQAGVVVLTASIFAGESANAMASGHVGGGGLLNQAVSMSIDGHLGVPKSGYASNGIDASIDQMLTGSKIQHIATQIRERIYDVSFNNTTELNSTVYFCRANHNEFNYSANPTYLQSSKIRVKDVPSDMPISYVTSIGLYSPDNELMATAKLSEPLRKDPTNELTLRVRLDY